MGNHKIQRGLSPVSRLPHREICAHEHARAASTKVTQVRRTRVSRHACVVLENLARLVSTIRLKLLAEECGRGLGALGGVGKDHRARRQQCSARVRDDSA